MENCEWSPIARSYDPILVGSIDATDAEPHDRGIIRALECKYRPNKGVVGDPECSLFVGRLNPATVEDQIRDLFSKYGKIKRCRLVRDFITGSSKGYAFVEFNNRSDAKYAISNLNHSVVDDKTIIVMFECERNLPGWIPRRFGGGFGGNKESGQLRFGGIERPFRRPIVISSRSSSELKSTIPTNISESVGQPSSYHEKKQHTNCSLTSSNVNEKNKLQKNKSELNESSAIQESRSYDQRYNLVKDSRSTKRTSRDNLNYKKENYKHVTCDRSHKRQSRRFNKSRTKSRSISRHKRSRSRSISRHKRSRSRSISRRKRSRSRSISRHKRSRSKSISRHKRSRSRSISRHKHSQNRSHSKRYRISPIKTARQHDLKKEEIGRTNCRFNAKRESRSKFYNDEIKKEYNDLPKKCVKSQLSLSPG